MYNGLQRMTEPSSLSGGVSRDMGLSVVDLYARLAADRAVEARIALRHSQGARELLAQSAQALEDAAGTLTLVSEMYAEEREQFSHVLRQQASALVVLAAQFEQAADLARHEQSGGAR